MYHIFELIYCIVWFCSVPCFHWVLTNNIGWHGWKHQVCYNWKESHLKSRVSITRYCLKQHPTCRPFTFVPWMHFTWRIMSAELAKCRPQSLHMLFWLFFTVGHTVLAINGEVVRGRQLEASGKDVLEMIADSNNYPIAIKFGRPKLSTNERIMLASMFHS